MNYWRINTDYKARSDVRTCDLWYRYRMVFAGDYEGKELEHSTVFDKLSLGDGVFMHDSGRGIVGYGTVIETWDRVTYKSGDRLLYNSNELDKEAYEYRIAVDWSSDCDCRENPLSISDRLPYMGTFSYVDTKKWNIDNVVLELREQSKLSKTAFVEVSIECLPTKEDFESAYRALIRPGGTIAIDSVLDQIERSAREKGLLLKSNWRMITEKSIEIWAGEK